MSFNKVADLSRYTRNFNLWRISENPEVILTLGIQHNILGDCVEGGNTEYNIFINSKLVKLNYYIYCSYS